MRHMRSPRGLAVIFIALFVAAGPLTVPQASAEGPADIGEWTAADPVVWSIEDVTNGEAIHAIHLHTGQILMIDDFVDECDPSAVRLYDPSVGNFVLAPITEPDPCPHLLFCAGHTQLADGSIFVAGGKLLPGGLGPPYAHVFSHGAWQDSPHPSDMQYGRFYPTCTTLPDGRVLVLGGVTDTSSTACSVVIPEIYDPAHNTWEQLDGAAQDVGQYPHAFVLPDGNVAVVSVYHIENACPNTCNCTDYSITRILDLGSATPTWTDGPSAPWSGEQGSAVMYEPGKILRTGGAATGITGPTVDSAAIINLSDATPTWAMFPSMNSVRREHMLVLLPTGRVLAMGGQTIVSPGGGIAAHVLFPEWVDPSAPDPEWKELAEMTLGGRGHHMSAVLLPDGRVLVAGELVQDPVPPGNYNPRGEFFWPPYLFAGPPPAIASAPRAIPYDEPFPVTLSPGSPAIGEVTLLRLAATTHGFDQNQRFLSLQYDLNGQDPDTLDVTAPADPRVAPPGYYMLFVISADAVPVPSEAEYVKLVPCMGNIDGNEVVGIVDLLLLLAAWGPNPGHTADLDLDDVVGILDFLELLARWGPCPEFPLEPNPPSIYEAVADAGLTAQQWDDAVADLVDPAVSQAKKDNLVCWWEHYLDCHRRPFCFECACLICPDVDPYGNHWEP